MSELSKILIILGISILIIGIILSILPKIDFKGLPGDIYIKKDNFVFFFPIVTSIVLSILLTIILSVIFSIFRR